MPPWPQKSDEASFKNATVEQLFALWDLLKDPMPEDCIKLLENWIADTWQPYDSRGNSIDHLIWWIRCKQGR